MTFFLNKSKFNFNRRTKFPFDLGNWVSGCKLIAKLLLSGFVVAVSVGIIIFGVIVLIFFTSWVNLVVNHVSIRP